MDVTGWSLRLPNGVEIPQLCGDETYKYLGTELLAGWQSNLTHLAVRTKVVQRCCQLIRDIGMLRLSESVLSTAMELVSPARLGRTPAVPS